MPKTKTILVTGGAGFIGSHLCEKYLNEGHRVICVDNLQTTRTTKNIDHLISNPHFKFIQQDIIYQLRIREPIDWIFNFACSGSYTSYQFDPVHTTKTSTIGLINMLELARVHNARLMQASTSEIYGDPLETPQKETYTGNVNMLGPRACYDEGKRCGETLCMDYHREYGTDVKIIRIFNSYGPNMDPNDGRAVTNFIINALDGKDLVVYGDGSYTRSFQYIDDLVDGIDKMMRKDNLIGPVNLGNPGEVTILKLAELAIMLTNSKAKIVFTEGATDDPKRRSPDISRAKKELRWSPQTDLEEGFKKTISYFKTVKRPEKKVLVFATTYHPDMGPAERALHELSNAMSDTEFHIITTKFRKNLPSVEQFGSDTIYRVGIGSIFDKYLLPLNGFLVAKKLQRKHKYSFTWSIMASYGGLGGLLFKLFNRDVAFLITLDDREVGDKRPMLFSGLTRIVLRQADKVYISNLEKEQNISLLKSIPNLDVRGGDTNSFVNKVRLTYADILNKKEHKLARPK